MMTAHVKLDDRLSILREGDRLRKWNSLNDQWFDPQAPVVSEIAEPDRWCAGKQPAQREARSILQAHGYRV